MSVQVDREKLRELCEKAAPGPWESRYERGWFVYGQPITDGSQRDSQVADLGYSERDDPGSDAAFIAAARTAVPELLSLLEQAEARANSIATDANEEVAILEARVRELEDALRELAGMNWTGVAEVEEASAWVRSKAQAALEARPR